MKELISAGGAAYLMPAVLFALVLYVVRGASWLHGRRSQQRKEFLELWSDARRHDDVWLEVGIRHLHGTYLPAHVIRLALAQPDKSQSLFHLSELWPLLRYDSEAQTVDWLHWRHNGPHKRRVGRVMMVVGYFALAFAAVGAGWAASMLGHGSFGGWVYGVCAVTFGVLALVCLMRDHTIEVAATVGEAWMGRINAHAVQKIRTSLGAGLPNQEVHSDPCFSARPSGSGPD